MILTRLRRLLRTATGFRFIEIEEDSYERLALRYGGRLTIFERAGSAVTQDGRLVATFPTILRIELHQPPNQDGPINWFVTVRVQGSRQVEVGQVTDQTDASIIGARIATITSRPVTVLH